MVPDDEDSRDFDSSLQPITDMASVDEPSNDLPSQTTTDISSVLEQDSVQEVK